MYGMFMFFKSIKVKLLNTTKKKACEELKPWIISTCNHFWWSCATCDGDEIIMKENQTTIVFYIQNKHCLTENTLYHQFSHSEVSKVDERCKSRLSPKSQDFEALQSIVFDKNNFGGYGASYTVLTPWCIGIVPFST